MNAFNPFSIRLEGQHLIEASAGTGKTYNITSLFIRCLLDRDMDIDEVLVLTYTKAATAELKERIMSRIRDSIGVLKEGKASGSDEFMVQLLDHVDQPNKATEQLEEALHNFDEASIFTIHSFCQRALQEQSFLSGILFDSELVTDDSELIQEVIDDWWRHLVEQAENNLSDRIWLNILKEENYLPDNLADTVAVGLGKPYLNYIINDTPEGSRQEELEELLGLFTRLKENWFGNEDNIQRQLLSDAMNGNRYRASSVPGWIDQMSEWLNSEVPSLNLFDNFDRFSIDFIREEGTKKGKEPPQHPFYYGVKAFIEQAERVRRWIPVFKKEMLEYTREAVRYRKLSSGVLGYDDLLVLLQEALERPKTGKALAKFLRNKFPVALVDEFQDTDPIQYDILRSIYTPESSDTALFLVGDPKQSIYNFRGADVFSYLNARNNVPEKNRYSLKRNFRSHPDFIEGVNSLFKRLDNPFLVEEITFSPVNAADIEVPAFKDGDSPGPTLQFIESTHLVPDSTLTKKDARDRAADITAESIAKLLSGGKEGHVTIGDNPVRPKDVAVLVRTHRQADLIRQKFQKRRIKCVQYSEKSVFDTMEARNMELLLKAVAEPRNDRIVRTVLATELFQYNAEQLYEFEEDEQRWTQKLAEFSGWNKSWKEYGFTSMFHLFLKETEVKKHLVAMEHGERKLTNILQLRELLQAREQDQQGGMFELIKWLARKRKDPDKKAEEEQLRLESDEELVRIVTMHRSKGLEYPIVYCPFLWDGAHYSDSGDPFIFHDPKNEYQPTLDFSEKGSSQRDLNRMIEAWETLSESLRLAYVALTRAKQHCSVVYESASGMEFSSLGYLLLGANEIEQQLEGKFLSNTDALTVQPERFRNELRNLLREYPSVFECRKIDEEQITYFESERADGKSEKKNRTFSRSKQIQSRSVVSSFSSIMHPASSKEEEPLDDEFFLPEELQSQVETPSDTIFGFPKGPQAGTCVHTIFEEINFAKLDNVEEIVESTLEQFGFDKEWTNVISAMVEHVIQKELRQQINLDQLSEQKVIKEMEFYYDLQAFERGKMLEIIRGNNSTGDFQVNDGYMKGFIDLVFEIDNRFYIADYKTNYLGDSPQDYLPKILAEEMQTAGYDIQYHIYTVALHRYLKQRLPKYSYQKNFGGAFYLFVRGIGKGTDQEGIFFDRPDEAVITHLDQLFNQEVRHNV